MILGVEIYVQQGSSGGSAKCPESPDMPSGHVRSHSGDAVLKKNPSRLPVCIVAQFMHGGEADSRAIVQSTTHDLLEAGRLSLGA